MIRLEALGFSPFFSVQVEMLARPDLSAARVSADGQDVFPLVGCQAHFGELSGKLRQRLKDRDVNRPAVGDWVTITEHGERAVIHHVLERKTRLARRAAGSDAEAQTIAANVDYYFVVTAAGRDLNARRLERYLTAVWDSGASPIIVINKADLADDIELLRRELEDVAQAVPVLAVSAHLGSGVELLRAYLSPGITAAFVGSSGVGKSSLVNRLIDGDVQAVASVGIDGKGRHTTTRRELVTLATGGVLIDTPGLREFGILEASRGLDIAFGDITELSNNCRFGNCSHSEEPGCCVREAVANGKLAAERLESFHRLRKEGLAAEARRRPAWGNSAKQRSKALSKLQRGYSKMNGRDD
ncbi:MAG TPA: ribosome small subunit-dependent GTPase A [Polyangiaceae bacterium]